MDDGIFCDPFGTQSVTPDFGSFRTRGTSKLLVVIFVVDCSKTMKGDRIGAVNAALHELKYKLTEIKNDNSLELKIAIMSFASNAKWELTLTPIEEVSLNTINIRPGLTEYGAVFHELNKVLRKESYMKHTGKIAPPAIMFLTDGEPEDNYQADLDELLKNAWFTNASRSAVLVGDAIYNESAKNAVRQFVRDGDKDIVTAEDSTVIMQKIKLATLHTIGGDPMRDAEASDEDSSSKGTQNDTDTQDSTPLDDDDPYATFMDTGGDDLFGGDPSGLVDGSPITGAGSFGGDAASSDPDVSAADDSFGGIQVDDDSFGNISGDYNPFGDGGDPLDGLI